MLKELLLLALTALCMSEGYHLTGKTADMDFLHKQKKIYELMFFVKQNTLTDTEFYEIGRNYDMESNIDMYKDKVLKLKNLPDFIDFLNMFFGSLCIWALYASYVLHT